MWQHHSGAHRKLKAGRGPKMPAGSDFRWLLWRRLWGFRGERHTGRGGKGRVEKNISVILIKKGFPGLLVFIFDAPLSASVESCDTLH